MSATEIVENWPGGFMGKEKIICAYETKQGIRRLNSKGAHDIYKNAVA